MKQTAMQQLLAQLKDERANLPMSKEWDRCYQAIEMVIQNTYLPIEKEQIKHTYLTCWKDYTGWDGKHWEMGRDPNITFNEYYNETFTQEDTEDTWDGKWEPGEIDPSGCSGPYANI